MTKQHICSATGGTLLDMTIDLRVLAIALAMLVSTPAAAQTQLPPGEQAVPKNQRADRAKARCEQNHGVDCDKPEGLAEWQLQERSREEAIRAGARHPLPPQPKPGPAPSRP